MRLLSFNLVEKPDELFDMFLFEDIVKQKDRWKMR